MFVDRGVPAAIMTAGRPQDVCEFKYENGNAPSDADARLMAAAPDLLNAILKSDDAYWTPDMRAAIAKATNADSFGASRKPKKD